MMPFCLTTSRVSAGVCLRQRLPLAADLRRPPGPPGPACSHADPAPRRNPGPGPGVSGPPEPQPEPEPGLHWRL